MKRFNWSTLLVTFGLTMCIHNQAIAAEPDSNQEVWRGALEIQTDVYMTDGDKVTLDSPNQGLFNHELSSVELSDRRLSFKSEELSASFSGKFNGDELAGEFIQGKTYPLTLYKLNTAGQAMLAQEQAWAGDLIINGSARLPLQLNIAVSHNGHEPYLLATLDSPKQESYGIPVSTIHLEEQQSLSFTSDIIGASYEGSWKNNAWQGTFTQGAQMPLTLEKVDRQRKASQPPSPQASLSGDLEQLLEKEFGQNGVAVAVIHYQNDDTTPTITRLTHGLASKADALEVTDTTLFEIGSVTKTMLGYLLADALINGVATEKKLSAETELNDLLPFQQHNYKLIDLVTHHSGLPRLPANLLPPSDPANPYAHYSAEDLLVALEDVELAAEREYAYSNFGFGLLGFLLADAQQMPLDLLLQRKLFEPMHMTTAILATTDSHSEKLAQGYDIFDQPASRWTFDAMAGAGAVSASLNDMINYVRHHLRPTAAISPVVELATAPVQSIDSEVDIGFAWMIDSSSGARWHNGQTAGFNSFVGFNMQTQRGVVLLANHSISVTPLGKALLTTNNITYDERIMNNHDE